MIQASDIVAGRDVINTVTINQYKEAKRKEWRTLPVFTYPTENIERDLQGNWRAHLIYNIRRSFKNKFTAFTVLFETGDVSPDIAAAAGASWPTHTITFTTNHANLVGNIHTSVRALWTEPGRKELQQQINAELIALQKDWVVNVELRLHWPVNAHKVVYDPARRRLDIHPVLTPSTLIEDYEERLATTREILIFFAAAYSVNSTLVVSLPDFALGHYPLIKLYRALAANRASIDNLRINARDAEEWDYIDPQLDAEFAEVVSKTA